VDGDTVILQGTVGSFYEKQLCISSSQRVPGVNRLVDKIEVVWPGDEEASRR
jgi:osmotically-inducible protein OsmY